MPIAHQTEVVGAASTASGNYDTAFTPAAALNGLVVVIHVNASTADLVTSVSYGIAAGAVPLARAPSPYGFATEPTEPGSVYIYWAGDSVVWPTGTQTLRIVRGGTNERMQAVISSMTVAAGQRVTLDNGGSGSSTSQANPSWVHDALVAGVLAYLGIHSGLTTMTTTPATGWTLQSSTDIGAQGCGFARRTLGAAGTLGAGWTASTADDFVGASISFKEAPPPVAGLAPPPNPPARRILPLLAA